MVSAFPYCCQKPGVRSGRYLFGQADFDQIGPDMLVWCHGARDLLATAEMDQGCRNYWIV
jgi:hypothetical protein